MTLYLDTSLWVAVFAMELETARTTEWLAHQSEHELAFSPWVRTEFASALSAKLRTGQLGATARDEALELFEAIASQALTELPIQAEDFHVAADWCRNHESGLRAGDALHLSVTKRSGSILCTLDRRLAAAGKLFAVETLLV